MSNDYYHTINQLQNLNVKHLSLNSKQLNAETAFVAISGAKHHGLEFVHDAIAAHSPCVIIDADENFITAEIPIVRIKNLASNLGNFAAEFYQHPTRKLSLHAVTGTNGKTSCSQFMAQALTLMGESCGVVGTLGMGVWPDLTANINTTPDAISLQRFFAKMVQQNIKHVCMEASSIALVAGRMQGCFVDSALFTNLTQDHLDYHHTMEAYGAAKQMLFEFPGIQHVIINADDDFGQKLLQYCVAKGQCWSFGKEKPNCAGVQHLQILNAHFNLQGIQAEIQTPQELAELTSPLLGQFNLENLLTVFAWLLARGLEVEQALALIKQLKTAQGRMMAMGGGDKPLVVIDYAHTPDALEKALKALRGHCEGKLYCVFGCGGNRDKTKRPIMGEIAHRLADVVVVTSDNPRDEDPLSIIQEIVADHAMHFVVDRAQAIAEAISQAKGGDIVLIAGKGHENYQEIKGERFAFDDAIVAKQCILPTKRAAGEATAAR